MTNVCERLFPHDDNNKWTQGTERGEVCGKAPRAKIDATRRTLLRRPQRRRRQFRTQPRSAIAHSAINNRRGSTRNPLDYCTSLQPACLPACRTSFRVDGERMQITQLTMPLLMVQIFHTSPLSPDEKANH